MKRKNLPKINSPDPDQIMLAGVAPVSLGERLGWLANQPMQPRRAQRPLDIGFWNPMRDQIEMFLQSCNLSRPVPRGTGQARYLRHRTFIGATAYGRHAATRNGVAHDFAFHQSSSRDRLKYISRSFRHGSNRQVISERQQPSRAPTA